MRFATLLEVVRESEDEATALINMQGNPAESTPGNGKDALWQWFFKFLALFPALLALQYIVFSVLFHASKEKGNKNSAQFTPRLSIFVPAHNEAENIENTLKAILQSDYPNFEVIVIDDGSTDNTAGIAGSMEGVRVLRLEKNYGKAHALNYALANSRGDFVVCIDADTIIEKNTLKYLVRQLRDPNIVGVTGNPQIRNQKGFLRKLQTMEYATIISVIKRAESLLGGLYTVSGAICAFRRSALESVGGWNEVTQTEDIDISWRLQKHGYRIVYEPQAVCWISVPGSFGGLFRQRVRWSRGSGEAYRNQLKILRSSNTATVPIVLNGIVSSVWTISLLMVLPLMLFGYIPENPHSISMLFTSVLFLHLQSGAGILMDRPYNSRLLKYFFVTPFFIFYFWLLVLPSFIMGFFTGLMGERDGKWIIERA